MARVENKPKIFLTKEEIETLNKTRKLLCEISLNDNDSYIFDTCDNGDNEWWWIDSFLENLMDMSEVEENV